MATPIDPELLAMRIERDAARQALAQLHKAHLSLVALPEDDQCATCRKLKRRIARPAINAPDSPPIASSGSPR